MIRRMSLVLLLAILLAACGGQPTAVQPTTVQPAVQPTSAPDATSAPTSAPTATTVETASAATTAQSTTAASSQPIVIAHEQGTLELAAPAQRIVVLDYSFLDSMLALGVEPVGAAIDATGGDRGVPPYLQEQAKSIASAGARPQPNFEQIVALKPDVIIADVTAQADFYDQLNQIAPTVLFNSRRGSLDDLNQQLLDIGRMVGKEAEAQALLDAQAKLLEQAQAQAKTDAPPLVLAVATASSVTIHSTESFIGSLLTRMGRTIAVAPREGQSQFEIELEGFTTLQPERLVLFTGKDETPLTAEWSQNPLWNQLAAVQQNRVYTFDRDLWTRGRGPLALELIVNEALASGLLGDTTPQTANVEAANASAETPKGVQVLETTAEYRLVKHKFGETNVPLNPQRVVILDPSVGIAYLLSLGLTPVGATNDEAANNGEFPAVWGEAATTIGKVGTIGKANLEEVGAFVGSLSAETIA